MYSSSAGEGSGDAGGGALALLETRLPGLPVRRGKVRDVYELGGGRLLIVATDRISAFDWVLPNGIPDKGRVLTALSAFWFARTATTCSRPTQMRPAWTLTRRPARPCEAGRW